MEGMGRAGDGVRRRWRRSVAEAAGVAELANFVERVGNAVQKAVSAEPRPIEAPGVVHPESLALGVFYEVHENVAAESLGGAEGFGIVYEFEVSVELDRVNAKAGFDLDCDTEWPVEYFTLGICTSAEARSALEGELGENAADVDEWWDAERLGGIMGFRVAPNGRMQGSMERLREELEGTFHRLAGILAGDADRIALNSRYDDPEKWLLYIEHVYANDADNPWTQEIDPCAKCRGTEEPRRFNVDRNPVCCNCWDDRDWDLNPPEPESRRAGFV